MLIYENFQRMLVVCILLVFHVQVTVLSISADSAPSDCTVRIVGLESYLPVITANPRKVRYNSTASAEELSMHAIYNPSLYNSKNGEILIIFRVSFLLGANCGKSEADYACMRAHLDRFTEMSIIATLDSNTCLAKVIPHPIPKKSISIYAWNSGYRWLDTKLFPLPEHNPPADESVWITSQRYEHQQRNVMLNAVTNYMLIFVAYSTVSNFKTNHRMKLAYHIYHDSGEPDWATPHTLRWMGSVSFSIFDALIELCPARAVGQKQLPQSLHVRHKEASSASFDVQDKNWVAFAYGDRVLWSYMIHPHIVCENDIDLRRDTAECVLCERRYATNSSELWDSQTTRLKALRNASSLDGVHVKYHLNGVPAYLVVTREGSFYLGIAHAVLSYNDGKMYIHFFYKTEAQAPFKVIALSKPIELQSEASIGHWFAPSTKTDVAFVNGFTIQDDVLSISYGAGDHIPRIFKLSQESLREYF